MHFGRTLKIFVMGADPDCLKTVEIANWTGLAFIGSREQLPQIKGRAELASPGIYFLLDDDANEGGLVDFYVGETDDFSSRILNHAQSKDWWTKFVVFVSKDQNLTKAHVKYLEREIYLLSTTAVTTLKLKNNIEPGGSRLPESDISSMQEFLSNIRFVLEALGLSYFPRIIDAQSEPIQRPNNDSSFLDLNGQEFHITLSKSASPNSEQLKSYMKIQDGVYILKSGSYIMKSARESFENHDSSYYSLWKQITESDAVKPSEHDSVLVSTRDLEFRSPSAAAAVVRGRTTNGRTNWRRVSDGKSLSECQTGRDESKGAA